MLEYVLDKAVNVIVSVAGNVFSQKLDQHNNDELAVKRQKFKNDRRKSNKGSPTQEQLNEIFLDDVEKTYGKISIDKVGAKSALKNHLDLVESWSSSVNFSDAASVKRLMDIFVQLDTYVTPRRIHISDSEVEQIIPLLPKLLNATHHAIVQGGPGAGKTTSMKALCQAVLSETRNGESRLPILIRFRELGLHAQLSDTITDIFKASFEIEGSLATPGKAHERARLVGNVTWTLIDNLAPVIILDGFDEYPDPSYKADLVEQIRQICVLLKNATVVLTCRTGEFNYSINGVDDYEIAPLSNAQISEFAHTWLGDSQSAKAIIEGIGSSPFADTAIRPLTMAHLCAIYERIGRIPDKPKTVYRKVVSLLLEDWDQQRSVRRPTKYAQFEADRKFEFLCNLAYILTTTYQAAVFSRANLLNAFECIAEDFDLHEDSGRRVIEEIESHTGLFVQAGFERYEFAHKSIQEYLTAEYIVRLPVIGPSDPSILEHLGAELAIATSISSNSSRYLFELTFNLLTPNPDKLPRAFYDALIQRLLLEKPDFVKDPQISLAAMSILTLWVNSGSTVKSRYSEHELGTFNALLRQVLKGEGVSFALEFYDSAIGGVAGEDYFVTFRRRKTLEFEYPLLHSLLIPKPLLTNTG